MPKGVCPLCGKIYFGWALKERRRQFCDLCGSELVIYEKRADKFILKGYKKGEANVS